MSKSNAQRQVEKSSYDIGMGDAQDENWHLPEAFALQLAAKPHRPVYRMHRYFARRPYNLFAELVQHFTRPGDLVVDPFMGGGVTLVEATERGRRAIGFDTNPLAGFVTRTELLPLDSVAYSNSVKRVVEKYKAETADLYHTTCRQCAGDARVRWYEHSLVSRCGACEATFKISTAEKVGLGTWSCPRCSTAVKAAPTHDSNTSLVQLLVECAECGTNAEVPNALDLERQTRIDASRDDILAANRTIIPDDDIPDNNMQRESALHKKGITKFHHFFTARQLLALVAIRRAIRDEPKELQTHLLLAFSSTLRFANRMVTRNPAWRGDRPLEWVGTGFWLPTVFLDANLEIEFERRASAVMKGKKDFLGPTFGGEGTTAAVADGQDGAAWAVETRSSTSMPLPDNSVDAVVTDPPYGSYVHYADMSNFWNVWLPEDLAEGTGALIDASEEAVVARKQFPGAKNVSDYGKLLQSVFEECHRVLKPNRSMVLTFNNREPRAWTALLLAALHAGFYVPEGGVHFQPGVKGYSHTARTRRLGSVLGDFVITFVKRARGSAPINPTNQTSPLDPAEIETRLCSLVQDRPLTTDELLRSFYASLIPDILEYIENNIRTAEEAEDHLRSVDTIDLFDSERGGKLTAILQFHEGRWSQRRTH